MLLLLSLVFILNYIVTPCKSEWECNEKTKECICDSDTCSMVGKQDYIQYTCRNTAKSCIINCNDNHSCSNANFHMSPIQNAEIICAANHSCFHSTIYCEGNMNSCDIDIYDNAMVNGYIKCDDNVAKCNLNIQSNAKQNIKFECDPPIECNLNRMNINHKRYLLNTNTTNTSNITLESDSTGFEMPNFSIIEYIVIIISLIFCFGTFAVFIIICYCQRLKRQALKRFRVAQKIRKEQQMSDLNLNANNSSSNSNSNSNSMSPTETTDINDIDSNTTQTQSITYQDINNTPQPQLQPQLHPKSQPIHNIIHSEIPPPPPPLPPGASLSNPVPSIVSQLPQLKSSQSVNIQNNHQLPQLKASLSNPGKSNILHLNNSCHNSNTHTHTHPNTEHIKDIMAKLGCDNNNSEVTISVDNQNGIQCHHHIYYVNISNPGGGITHTSIKSVPPNHKHSFNSSNKLTPETNQSPTSLSSVTSTNMYLNSDMRSADMDTPISHAVSSSMTSSNSSNSSSSSCSSSASSSSSNSCCNSSYSSCNDSSNSNRNSHSSSNSNSNSDCNSNSNSNSNSCDSHHSEPSSFNSDKINLYITEDINDIDNRITKRDKQIKHEPIQKSLDFVVTINDRESTDISHKNENDSEKDRNNSNTSLPETPEPHLTQKPYMY